MLVTVLIGNSEYSITKIRIVSLTEEAKEWSELLEWHQPFVLHHLHMLFRNRYFLLMLRLINPCWKHRNRALSVFDVISTRSTKFWVSFHFFIALFWAIFDLINGFVGIKNILLPFLVPEVLRVNANTAKLIELSLDFVQLSFAKSKLVDVFDLERLVDCLKHLQLFSNR